jgi:hypothetical protein
MKALNLLIDHEVLKAEIELEGATAVNVLERAKVYFALLCAFRRQLQAFAHMTGLRPAVRPKGARGDSADRPVDPIATAIEVVESEVVRVDRLIVSFTTISTWEAAQIFNRVRYRGSNEWEAAANEVRTAVGTERMPAENAVEAAGMLLREEYAAARRLGIATH